MEELSVMRWAMVLPSIFDAFGVERLQLVR
jgi:hypothetical protein